VIEQIHRNYWSIEGNRPRRADFAAAIAFLAGERAAFITGQTLFVDGGAQAGSALLVIFGASGDLARRKLIPGLYNMT
jgi:NAD(P)-dependent dehydrogenase (short-subunit alcohol dehydrogenase family)